jgi:MtrB/PioB family decaheme-associated outer membrane protein
MWHGRRWASVALSAAVAAILCLATFSRALAADAGPRVLGWNVTGSIEAGGMWSAGEHNSSKFDDYRDMDNGFLGELYLKGEKNNSPYHFDIWAKNPARDDQAYEGALGQYGLFRLDLGWDRVRHVLSNSAQTIFHESGGDFTLDPAQRAAIEATFAGGVANRANIAATIYGLGRPVDLAYNTDVGFVGLQLTPTEGLRFNLEYNNRRNEGTRATSATMANDVITELAIPLDQMTHEAKFMAEYAKPNFAIQLGYTGSFFDNEFKSYRWDNPVTTTDTQARGEISAAPDNTAHTFSLTGRGTLPWWRTNISGAASYTMLRQDETFVNNVAAPGVGVTPTNADDAGRTSADAKANLASGNILLTTRPIKSVTATARYRYYEYQNDTPIHSFTDTVAQAGDVTLGSTFTTTQARFTKQNAGMEIGFRPVRQVSLKAGYEYEHWSRGDFDGKSFRTDEHIGKAALDLAPTNWFLGRVTYTYGYRNLNGYGADPLAGNGPGFLKFNYADRVRNRADALLQFSRWETFTPSLNFGYAYDNFNNSAYGLTDDRNFSAGTSVGWTPLSWLTFSADYTYERHDATQRISQGAGATNPFETKSKDEFHIVNVGAILDIVPKKLDLNLGYGVTFGYTTIDNTNLLPTCAGATCAFRYDKIQNVLQIVRVVARYRLTNKLSIRGGFAYERFTERNFALDPMLAYMGFYDTSAASSQSVWLGGTIPNYEAYILSGFVRYQF